MDLDRPPNLTHPEYLVTSEAAQSDSRWTLGPAGGRRHQYWMPASHMARLENAEPCQGLKGLETENSRGLGSPNIRDLVESETFNSVECVGVSSYTFLTLTEPDDSVKFVSSFQAYEMEWKSI
ncbi:hypothetical protein J6590_028948 [Homalodisca vitripennis]|nr:hypothetical protein J6590_028948 [Homalodisca vitripennis]